MGLTPLAIEPDPVPEADAGAAFRSAVEKRQAQLAAVLEDASITFDGRAVRIVFDPPNLAAEKRLGEPALAKALEEAAVTVFGKGARAVVEGALPPGGDLTAAAAEADADTLERESLKRRVSSDERVKRMLELFDAEIADVKRDEGES